MNTKTNLEDPTDAKETSDACVEHAIFVAASAALFGVGIAFPLEVFQAVLVVRILDTWAPPCDAAYFFFVSSRESE